MTKNDLIKQIMADTNYARVHVERIVDEFIILLGDAVRDGEKVTFPNFMSIEVVERAANRRYDPQEGKVISVPPSAGIKVTFSPVYKKEINEYWEKRKAKRDNDYENIAF